MDTSQYLELFIDETKEHLQSLNEHILELEKEKKNYLKEKNLQNVVKDVKK